MHGREMCERHEPDMRKCRFCTDFTKEPCYKPKLIDPPKDKTNGRP